MSELTNKELASALLQIYTESDSMWARKRLELAAERLEAMPDTGSLDVINSLLDYAWKQTCTHEETHRAGFLWEICDSCGCKWADDEGGRPEFETPKAIMDAEVYLAKIRDSEK